CFHRPCPPHPSTLSLHDALPISPPLPPFPPSVHGPSQLGESQPSLTKQLAQAAGKLPQTPEHWLESTPHSANASHTSLQLGALRSEEHTSELQSRENLVCRLLLE